LRFTYRQVFVDVSAKAPKNKGMSIVLSSENVRKHWRLCLLVALALATSLASSCSRDPNVRKHKYYNAAVRYFEKGHYDSAKIELRNAIRIDPRYADAHYEMAQCDLRLGLISQAYRELSNTVDLAPQYWKAQIDLGYLLLAGRKTADAEQKARLVRAHDPKNADACALLAHVEAAQGHVDQALVEMKKSVKLAPVEAKYLDLAMLEEGAKQLPAAEQDYQKAASLAPQSIQPVLALEAFYARQHRFAEAEQEAQKAIHMAPANPIPRAAIIAVYMAQGEKDKAEQTAKDAKQAAKKNPDGYRMLGQFYLATGQQDKALAEYRSLYQEHPEDSVVVKNFTQLLIARNDLDEAWKVNAAALKRDPADGGALIDKGEIQVRQGRPDDAVLTLQSVLKTQPDNPAPHYYLGMAYNQTGNADLAEREWRKTVELRPQAADAQQALAGLELNRREFGQLETTAQALVQILPMSPLGYSYRAVVSESKGNLKVAEEDLKKAIEVAPKNPLGYSGMGDLLTAEKRFREAESNYEQALQTAPGWAGALRGLAVLYVAQKQPEKAIDRVKQEIAKAPDNEGDYLLLGQLLASQKQYPEAEAALEKCRTLNTKDTNAVSMLGQVELAQGQRDKAAATYQQSIQQNPRDLASYVRLAIVEEQQGDWKAGQDLYRKALAIFPDNAAATNNLAYSMLEHGGNLDVALAMAQQARRAAPDSPGIADTLGWAYYKKGAYLTAIDLLREAVKKTPDDAEFQYHLGMAYEGEKDHAQALECLQKALKLDPGYAKAGEIRQTLTALNKE